MTKKLEVYKCIVCGSIVTVLHDAAGTLVCCNQPMQPLMEKTEDIGNEKHVPVIEKATGGVKVKVGAIPHPMEVTHYIEWIQVITKQDMVLQKFLKPGDAPEAVFKVDLKDIAYAREYCNLHGLWRSKS